MNLIKVLEPFDAKYENFMIVLHHNKYDYTSDLSEIFFNIAVTNVTSNFYITESCGISYISVYRNGIRIAIYNNEILYSSLLDWITIIECKNKSVM